MELISEEIQVKYNGVIYARCDGDWYEVDGDMYHSCCAKLSFELENEYRSL